MAFYIKVTREVADKLGVAGIRNSTADGNVLLWQADVAGFPGDTVFDRAAVVGGVCLSPQQAFQLRTLRFPQLQTGFPDM